MVENITALKWQTIRSILIKNNFRIGKYEKRRIIPAVVNGCFTVSQYTKGLVRINIYTRSMYYNKETVEQLVTFLKSQKEFEVEVSNTWITVGRINNE